MKTFDVANSKQGKIIGVDRTDSLLLLSEDLTQRYGGPAV